MARSVLGSLPQYATAIATQASADAFATTRIETGISTASKYAWMLDRIEFFYRVADVTTWIAGACSIEAQVAQGATPAALVTPDSSDFICCDRIYNRSDGTEANFQTLQLRSDWTAPENFVVVDPSLNFSIDSTATGASNVVTCRIWYWPVELSEMDILRMLALR